MKKSMTTLFTALMGIPAIVGMQDPDINTTNLETPPSTCTSYLPDADMVRRQIAKNQRGTEFKYFNFTYMGIDWSVYQMNGGQQANDGFKQVHFWFKNPNNYEHAIQGFSARYVIKGVTYSLQAKTPDFRISPQVIAQAYETLNSAGGHYGVNGSQFSGIHWFEAPTYGPENLPIERDISLKTLASKVVANLLKGGNPVLEDQVPQDLAIGIKDFREIAK